MDPLHMYSQWLLHSHADRLDQDDKSHDLVFAIGQEADGVIVLPDPTGWFVPDHQIGQAIGRLGYPCDALYCGYVTSVDITTQTQCNPMVLSDRKRITPHVVSWMFDVTRAKPLSTLMNMETGETVDVTSVAFRKEQQRWEKDAMDAMTQPIADNEASSRRLARQELRRMADDGRLVVKFSKPGTFRRLALAGTEVGQL